MVTCVTSHLVHTYSKADHERKHQKRIMLKQCVLPSPVDKQNLQCTCTDVDKRAEQNVFGAMWPVQMNQCRAHPGWPPCMLFLPASCWKLETHLLAQDLPGLRALAGRQLVLQVLRLRCAEDGAGGVLQRAGMRMLLVSIAAGMHLGSLQLSHGGAAKTAAQWTAKQQCIVVPAH